jgi:tetratricopeptide (TPR) repeat protein
MTQQKKVERLRRRGNKYLHAEDFDEANKAFGQALELDARDPMALLGRALSLRKLGEYQAAQHVLNRALYLHPSDPRLLNEQGLLRFDQEQYDKALEYLERALAITPNDQSILELKVRSLRSRGAPFDQAEKAMADALRQFPGDPAFLTEQAKLFYDRQRYDEAVEAFVQAKNEDPIRDGIISLRDEGRFAEAEQLIEAALSRLPKNVAIMNERGRLYYDREDYAEAVNAFDRTLELDPQNEEAFAGKIDALRQQGPPHDLAQKATTDALTKLPGNSALLTKRAWLYYDQKQYDQAVEAFLEAKSEYEFRNQIAWLRAEHQYAECEQLIEAALARLPNDVAILNLRGRLYLDREEYGEAVEAFDRTLEVDHQNVDAFVGKIQSWRRQSPPFDRAHKAIAEALAKLPGNSTLLAEQAWVYYDQKQYDRAVEVFVQAESEYELEGEINSLRTQRRFAECEQLIEAALSRLPNNVAILDQRGWLHFDQKHYKQAAAAFDQALGVEPGNEVALNGRSVSLRVQRRFVEAEAAIQEGLGRLPKSVALLNERGWVYYDQARYEQAIEAFDQTLRARPGNEDALQWKIRALRSKRDFAGAEKAIEEALALVPESAQILYERGKLHYDRDEYEKADEYYSKAITNGPNYLLSYYDRADALKRLNRGEDALEVLKGLMRERPDDLEVRNQLGWFYLARNDLSNAQKEFEAVLAEDPTSTVGINSMGAVYFNQGQYDRAEEEFRRALQVEPNDAAFHGNLAWALVRQVREASPFPAASRQPATWLERIKRAATSLTGSDQHTAADCLPEAEEHCRGALQIDPNYHEAYSCLGVIAFKRGKLIDSEDFLQTSVRLNPKEASYVDLGALYVQMGRYEEAGKVLEKARQLNRNDARARLELGNLYLQTDRPKDAMHMFREAMAVDPKSEEAPRALAIALMRSGEYTEAGRVLRKAIRELEEPKRWQLHLTLCQLLTDLGDKNNDPDLYDEALKEVLIATALKPEHPAPCFYAGIVRYKREEYQLARRSFRKCLEKDPNHFEAELNARRVEALLRREIIRTRVVQVAGIALGITCLGLLVILWILYFKTTDRITSTMVNTLSPILLGLVFIAFLLPWLSRLKLPGVEADLSQPKEKVSAGPTGSVGFGSSSLSSGPQ